MRTSRLKILCDLAATGSFSAAAKLNGISQPAVSQAVHALETELGATLIDHSQKTFSLTPEGVQTQRRSREILQIYERLRAELKEMQNVVAGTVRVGVVPSVAADIVFRRALRRFMEAFPQVELSLTPDYAGTISAKIARGELDIGVTILDKKSRGEEIFPLYDEALVAICAPSNTLVWRRETSLHELLAFPFLSYSENLVMRRVTDALFAAEKLNCVPARTFDNAELLKRAVELNAGVAIVPELSVRDETEAGTLRALKISGGNAVRTIVATSRKNRPLTPAMRRFIDALQRRRPA